MQIIVIETPEGRSVTLNSIETKILLEWMDKKKERLNQLRKWMDLPPSQQFAKEGACEPI
jgi:hypothetical protein